MLKKAGMLTRDATCGRAQEVRPPQSAPGPAVHEALKLADLRRLLDDGKPIFGTDGVRGVAGSELTPELALAIGRAAGPIFEGGPVVIGRDTRRSGEMLSSALQAGFHAVGIDTVDVGVLPSGGISYLTATSGATMGAVVSASHNPAEDNGIKLLAARGTKLPDEVEREIEDRLRSSGSALRSAPPSAPGFRTPTPSSPMSTHLVTVSRYKLRGLRIALDCANGAAHKAAPMLFERLEADVVVFGDAPDGNNINNGCGATHPEFLAEHAVGRIGLSFRRRRRSPDRGRRGRSGGQRRRDHGDRRPPSEEPGKADQEPGGRNGDVESRFPEVDGRGRDRDHRDQGRRPLRDGGSGREPRVCSVGSSRGMSSSSTRVRPAMAS